MDLSKIKAKISLSKNKLGKEVESFEILSNTGGWGGIGGVKRIAWSWIIANPVLAIKKDVRLARKTNATPEQIEFIQKTSLKELEKAIENGKDTTGSGRTKGKAVHSDNQPEGKD